MRNADPDPNRYRTGLPVRTYKVVDPNRFFSDPDADSHSCSDPDPAPDPAPDPDRIRLNRFWI